MTSIADRYGPVILITLLVGVPLGALAAALLIRARRRAGWSRSWAWRASISEVGMLVGTAPWLWMILTPTGGAGGLQLEPLRDLLINALGAALASLLSVRWWRARSERVQAPEVSSPSP